MRRVTIFLFVLTIIICFIGVKHNIGLGKYKSQYEIGFSTDKHIISASNPDTNGIKLKPVALTKYPPDAPAPNIPLLRWTIPPDTIYYEIEFLTTPAEIPNNTVLSVDRFYSSRQVFTNGYSADLSAYPGNLVYWRVRGIDYDNNPIGVFSDATPLYIDHTLPQILKPVSDTEYKQANVPMPLYPVYSWIPINGALIYEVEITAAPPENPNGILPSQYRIRDQIVKEAYDCYDEEALSTPAPITGG